VERKKFPVYDPRKPKLAMISRMSAVRETGLGDLFWTKENWTFRLEAKALAGGKNQSDEILAWGGDRERGGGILSTTSGCEGRRSDLICGGRRGKGRAGGRETRVRLFICGYVRRGRVSKSRAKGKTVKRHDSERLIRVICILSSGSVEVGEGD